MKILFRVTALALAVAAPAWAFQVQKNAARRLTATDEKYGFALEAPRFPGVEAKAPAVPLTIAGPTANGFTPSLNVTVTPGTTTAQAFSDGSKAKLERAGLKILAIKRTKVSGRDAVEFDYEGSINGSPKVRVLSVGVVDGDRVIQATCTTLADAFPAAEAEFRASLASLKLRSNR